MLIFNTHRFHLSNNPYCYFFIRIGRYSAHIREIVNYNPATYSESYFNRYKRLL